MRTDWSHTLPSTELAADVRSALVTTLFWLGPLLGCAGPAPPNLGIANEMLAPCPPTDNCVSSDASSEVHRVEPFRLNVPANEAWERVRQAVLELPRTTVVGEGDGYLRVECRSRLFRFVDDLELDLRPDEGIIAVRSASRVGKGDMGVNRKRVERLRARLSELGLIERL